MLVTEKEEMQKDFNEFMKDIVKQGIGNTVAKPKPLAQLLRCI